jgi:hypothetical protein
MKNTIKNIVSEAIDQARIEASNYNRTYTLTDVIAEIDCVVEFMKFDTEIAKNMFRGFCITEAKAVDSTLVSPKMYMDANGNYTSNSNLWV